MDCYYKNMTIGYKYYIDNLLFKNIYRTFYPQNYLFYCKVWFTDHLRLIYYAVAIRGGIKSESSNGKAPVILL
jgi:hypothetical protein